MPSQNAQSPLAARARLFITCCSIAANALCAGGIFTFPLISPALSTHLKLTQPQLTTIALAGMVGQYPFAALVGKIIDYYGPWACSLASSILFSLGFGLFAREIAKTPDDITAPSFSSFERLALFYFLAGLGTVTSYFSSLFAASKNFPNYIGVASGSSMALFGLSPLFLSVLATTFFTNDEDLDVTRYVRFMAILAGTVHLVGAFNLRTPSLVQVHHVRIDHSDEEASIIIADERTPLVAGKPPNEDASVVVIPVEDKQSVFDLLKDPYFWILAMIVLLSLGSCEMVISNIGTIVLSLPSKPDRNITSIVPPIAAVTSLQVRLLSISNTVSRLLVGPLADFVSPVALYLPCGTLHYPRKHRISRIAFLSASSLMLLVTFAWMDFTIRTQQGLWALSLGTGIAYGAIFTILPSIVSSIWGLSNLGRNFGVLTYAPFIGTPLFSYLYAFVSVAHVEERDRSSNVGDVVCKGVRCWQLTFSLASFAATVSLIASLVLWKRWKGRV
ncbi:MFS general substrate transporter [Rickenella mellea]|uniref:MFS general substrate transporter n=1 Tax=Rickenella mellea TaxID=50990 RepID=A0A4Y7QJU5_9AGAM|nr:MFS general substrate transporter [Rickenella mellea]